MVPWLIRQSRCVVPWYISGYAVHGHIACVVAWLGLWPIHFHVGVCSSLGSSSQSLGLRTSWRVHPSGGGIT